MNKNFAEILRLQLILEAGNFYNDNRDPYSQRNPTALKRIINFLKRIFFSRFVLKILLSSNFFYRKILLGYIFGFDKYIDKLDVFYNLLNDEESKALLVKLMAFRVLGHVKVKLPLSNPTYWEGIKRIEKIAESDQSLKIPFIPFHLNKYDLNVLNKPFKVYLDAKAAYITYFIKQYEYSVGNSFISPKPGDYIVDLGACFGDTALLFADQVGETGKVFSFEFIPGNIDIIKKNIDLNPKFTNTIKIIEHPVWEKSGLTVYYNEAGPQSVVKFDKFEGCQGETSTLSIDDLVTKMDLPHIDFIKSDIEGAEPFAIKGALKTIQKHKPKLAISIYHSMDDFTGIVKQIDDLKLGYKFYIGHCTIFASETILFATAD